MDTQQTGVAPDFSGTKAEKELAERLFQLFYARAAFFAADAPIRLNLSQIGEFLNATDGGSGAEKKADKALSANPEIFLREEIDDDVVFTTTRMGRPPRDVVEEPSDQNNLRARFATPEPRREPPRPRRSMTEHQTVTGVGDSRSVAEPEFAPDSWQAAVAAALREAQARERDQPATATPAEADLGLEEFLLDESETESAPAHIEELAEETAEDVDTFEAVDMSDATDEELVDALRNSLSHEPDVARWGDMWMHESKVAKLSRGDLRRAQEYIDENGEPLGDVELVQDLRGVNAGSPDFPLERFTVNFRLSREVRDFEYLGTSTEGLWATTNMPTIGTDARKASEIGQDYRFLLDYRTPPEDLEEGIIEHVLTFYEYQYGVLPLDAAMASIMPDPAFADQRAARITMESPQTGETVTVELRFPTSNRGGYIVGLEEFFESNLVPGALVTIEATDRPSHFILEYFQISGQDRRLLHLDERKNRYIFRPTTFYCGLQDDMLVDENRFPRLADVTPLDERTRRRPDQVVAKTFERIGENVGSDDSPRYAASIVDLLAAANVERPISVELLRDILTGGAYPEFSANDDEEDAFYYQP
ncbi:MAG TPA: hypothetical protein VHG52_05320 [Thermomicrobiales bacterium]|nr:hypothetical protein [Thermomicrobiales bacterium]